jgi:hypothetical protein
MDPSEFDLLDSSGFHFLGCARDREGPDGEIVCPITLLDSDTYRWLSVARAPGHDEQEELMKLETMTTAEWQAYYEAKDNDDPLHDHKSWAATARLACPLVDRLPPDVVGLDMDESGNLLSTTTDAVHNTARSTYYPSVIEYRLRRPVPTLLRSQLAVARRLAFGVDKVVHAQHGSARRARDNGGAALVMKYDPTGGPFGLGGVWTEIQIMAQFPPNHPHLLQLDSLVVEEISGLGVVGFTMPFIPSPTLDKLPPPRPLKLRWLRELMALVDELNLEFGLVHQDIAARNLIINPATDAILLIDFGRATAVGLEPNPYDRAVPEASDVKGVVAMAYYLVTRDPRFACYTIEHIDEKEVADCDKWVNPPGVELDHDASVFYDEVMAWATKRRSGPHMTHYTQAPSHFDFPMPPDPPEDFVVLDGVKTNLIAARGGSMSDRIRAGRPVLRWERPAASKVDKTRRLLVTGRYEDEEKDTPGIAVPDSKRGFPQPPVAVCNGVAAKPERDNVAGQAKRQKRRRSN